MRIQLNSTPRPLPFPIPPSRACLPWEFPDSHFGRQLPAPGIRSHPWEFPDSQFGRQLPGSGIQLQESAVFLGSFQTARSAVNSQVQEFSSRNPQSSSGVSRQPGRPSTPRFRNSQPAQAPTHPTPLPNYLPRPRPHNPDPIPLTKSPTPTPPRLH